MGAGAEPNAAPAKVTLTYMTTDGPIVKGPVRVPAGSRLSIRANDQVKNTDTSIKVHCDRPIIAERAMYWDKKGAGTNTVGAYSD